LYYYHDRKGVDLKRVIERIKEKRNIIETMVVSHFSEFPEDDDAIIEIKQNLDSRSTKQNKLYWQWLTVMTETGYTKDEMHVIMRDKFLGYEEVTTKTDVIRVLRSTTDLKVGEFKDYLEQIDIFASEYGIVLPRPEDLYLESMLNK
jgi:ribosomal protein L7/L12